MERVNVALLLDKLSASEPNFDYIVVDGLPSFADGAFACISGDVKGHTLLLEEARFLAAAQGQLFGRHVVAHEIAHHFLHASLLEGTGELLLPPQKLAQNRVDMVDTPMVIEQVVETLTEAEAECFATFLLVPWGGYLKGTEPRYLSRDYGEQPREVARYSPHFKNESVLNAFRSQLWKIGDREHPIFQAN